MIRFIVDTVSSKPDVYGNRYHFATITSTRTGKYLRLKDVGGPSNPTHLLRRMLPGLDWSEIHSTNADETIRRYGVLEKHHKPAKYEHQVTPDDITNLEI